MIEITREPPDYSLEFFCRLSVNLEWLPPRTKTMDASVNNAAFSQAALAHIDALYGYAMTLTRNATEAEDLVQETYLRATGAANQPQLNGNLKAWLFVIMRNAWLNQLRHDQSGPRFVELEPNEQTDDARGNPHVVYLRKLERSEEHTSELQSQSNLVCRL